jgi:hypothetical protein
MAHAARLAERGAGAFPMSVEDCARLAHYLPLIPQQAKLLNLSQFLAKPAAQDFLFLQPLVRCAQPSAAKAAFFSALPALKSALHTLHSPAAITPAAASTLAASIADAMDRAANAGGGVQR